MSKVLIVLTPKQRERCAAFYSLPFNQLTDEQVAAWFTKSWAEAMVEGMYPTVRNIDE